MWRNLAAGLVWGLCTAGCMHTHQATVDRPEEWLPKAQSDFAAEDVTVTFRDGAYLKGDLIRLTAASVSVRRSDPDTLLTFPLSSVNAISTAPGVGGTIGGMLMGAFVGALVGSLIGAESAAPEGVSSWGNFWDYWDETAKGGAIGAMVGGVAGGVLLGQLTAGQRYLMIHPTAGGVPGKAHSPPPVQRR